MKYTPICSCISTSILRLTCRMGCLSAGSVLPVLCIYIMCCIFMWLYTYIIILFYLRNFIVNHILLILKAHWYQRNLQVNHLSSSNFQFLKDLKFNSVHFKALILLGGWQISKSHKLMIISNSQFLKNEELCNPNHKPL